MEGEGWDLGGDWLRISRWSSYVGVKVGEVYSLRSSTILLREAVPSLAAMLYAVRARLHRRRSFARSGVKA